MGDTTAEETAEELQLEIDELHRQQHKITETLRDPRGLRREGLSGAASRNSTANGARQRAFLRPPDRRTEDEPPAKQRLSSAVVKVEGGEIKEDGSMAEDVKEKQSAAGENGTSDQSDKNPSSQHGGSWSRRDVNQTVANKEKGKLMHSDGWQIIHILGKPLAPPDRQPTVDVYASVIEPKYANTLVRHLCRIAPLQDLRHVKRVRKEILQEQGETRLAVILCLAPQHEGQLNNLPPDVQDLICSYNLSPFITKVCKLAASSKEEWEEQCKLWPTSYHPPTYNIDGIGGFSEEDSKSVRNFMKLVIELAISGDKPLVNAAVIVDPAVRQVIATETDQVHPSSAPRNTNSSETICLNESGASIHAQSFDGVTSDSAETFLNGALDKPKGLYSIVACLNPWRWCLQRNHDESWSQWHPLRHAAIVAIESSSARDRHLFPDPTDSHGMDHFLSFSVDSPAKKQKASFQNLNVQNNIGEDAPRYPLRERPYLCTGYDIFLLWEPCTMCAMALVHQRIKRIFYAFPNPTAGGLGSVERLQGEKRLNHHYAVFRVVLPEELLSAITRDELNLNGNCHASAE